MSKLEFGGCGLETALKIVEADRREEVETNCALWDAVLAVDEELFFAAVVVAGMDHWWWLSTAGGCRAAAIAPTKGEDGMVV